MANTNVFTLFQELFNTHTHAHAHTHIDFIILTHTFLYIYFINEEIEAHRTKELLQGNLAVYTFTKMNGLSNNMDFT